MFENLTTLDEIRNAVSANYAAMAPYRAKALGVPFNGGRLSLAVAEPGPLMEHAVSVVGSDGITLQELRDIFGPLGKERFDRGVKFMRDAGNVTERREKRPNRAGLAQSQVVFRAE